jgi:hypothetical protein
MTNEKNRVDFKLPNTEGRMFIQHPEEYITSYVQIGQEFRFGDGAFISTDAISVNKEDLPDFMNEVAGYHQLPAYTDLLNVVDALEHVLARLDGPEYSGGVFKGAIKHELRLALKGEKRENA